jgi:signal transduction histidine kinase
VDRRAQAPPSQVPGDPLLGSAAAKGPDRWAQLLDGQLELLSLLMGQQDFHAALEGICRLVEAFNPDILASVLLLNPDGRTVRHGAAPSLPKAYWNAIDGAEIGPAAGSCGTAMHRRQQVIVTDIAEDPLWAVYKAVALPFGLRACWSTPILSPEGEVEGAFAMYFLTPRAPDDEDLRLVGFAARLAGVALDRIRAQERLREANRQLEQARLAADQANQAKTEFLASMSHELRTPLNAILLFTELLAEDAKDAQVAKDLQGLQAAGQHLLALVNGILDLSKIEAGAMEVHLDEVPVEGLLAEVADAMRPLLEARCNRLVLEVDPALGFLRTDATKLRQVMLNLLGNANKFTEGGTLTVSAWREGGEARFRVQDTGIGMTPDQMARVFQAFAQGDGSTARRYGGTGLGLMLSRRLCELLGGTLTLESEAGRGTTLTAVLPILQSA